MARYAGCACRAALLLTLATCATHRIRWRVGRKRVFSHGSKRLAAFSCRMRSRTHGVGHTLLRSHEPGAWLSTSSIHSWLPGEGKFGASVVEMELCPNRARFGGSCCRRSCSRVIRGRPPRAFNARLERTGAQPALHGRAAVGAGRGSLDVMKVLSAILLTVNFSA